MAIEKARFGEKLAVQENIDPQTLLYLIPSLTIQPIIENAVTHGLKPKMEGGTISINIKRNINNIAITIVDDGVGMDLITFNPLQHSCVDHIGLMNVHERLHSQYGGPYGLTIRSTVGEGTAVTITIPEITANEGEANAQKFNC